MQEGSFIHGGTHALLVPGSLDRSVGGLQTLYGKLESVRLMEKFPFVEERATGSTGHSPSCSEEGMSLLGSLVKQLGHFRTTVLHVPQS